nr:hypothetical protein [Hepelivirales sp.]
MSSATEYTCPISARPIRILATCQCAVTHFFELYYFLRWVHQAGTCPISRHPAVYQEITVADHIQLAASLLAQNGDDFSDEFTSTEIHNLLLFTDLHPVAFGPSRDLALPPTPPPLIDYSVQPNAYFADEQVRAFDRAELIGDGFGARNRFGDNVMTHRIDGRAYHWSSHRETLRELFLNAYDHFVNVYNLYGQNVVVRMFRIELTRNRFERDILFYLRHHGVLVIEYRISTRQHSADIMFITLLNANVTGRDVAHFVSQYLEDN